MSAAKFKAWYMQNVVRARGVKHFDAHELVILSTVKGIRNTIPPEELWPHCIESIVIIDQLRQEIDRPLAITSGYRSPEYNAAVGGAKNSQHLQFHAFDITCQYVPPMALYNQLLAWRQQVPFAAGIGIYSTFVHFDTRVKSATWRGTY